ncbi:MAG: cytochrome c oxidase subunit 3 [Porticoccaceae bacterium]|nr:MAG: cytochrome c oxidase subunit 3 [SAR92 bacterium MED-G29]
MSTEGSYYVPEQSKLPLAAALGMGTMAFGAASWVIEGGTSTVFLIGTAIMAAVMYKWWSIVIEENTQGIVSDQLKYSYVLGMYWFIFSELMFFVCFFGSLFYVRVLVGPWLGGEAAIGVFDDTATDAAIANATHLWNEYDPTWPPLITPDQTVNAEGAKFVGPQEAMSFPGWERLGSWLPLYNTIVLISSSLTVDKAHHALKDGNRQAFIRWLGLTVFLGGVFLVLQAEEYVHAYKELGLTLDSGIYGTTFFLLTGFHGAHVTLGTIMLLISFLRGLKGHFNETDHFGFEAAAWYWHFVDVIWIGLFFIVYVFD